jgi:hypothetical protein
MTSKNRHDGLRVSHRYYMLSLLDLEHILHFKRLVLLHWARAVVNRTDVSPDSDKIPPRRPKLAPR